MACGVCSRDVTQSYSSNPIRVRPIQKPGWSPTAEHCCLAAIDRLMIRVIGFVALLLAIACVVVADTPASCMYEDVCSIQQPAISD